LGKYQIKTNLDYINATHCANNKCKATQTLKRKAKPPMQTLKKQQQFSAKQAAKEVKKATSTITRAIKTGKLSATKNENGDWEIQASELFRAYPTNANKKLSIESDANPKTQSANTNITNNHKLLEIEIKHLRERLIDKETSLDDKNEVIEDLRKRLDKAFLMIEDKSTKEQSKDKDSALIWLMPFLSIIIVGMALIILKSFNII